MKKGVVLIFGLRADMRIDPEGLWKESYEDIADASAEFEVREQAEKMLNDWPNIKIAVNYYMDYPIDRTMNRVTIVTRSMKEFAIAGVREVIELFDEVNRDIEAEKRVTEILRS